MILSVTICCSGSIFPSAAVSEQKADAVDVWDAFLRTFENRGLLDWEIEPAVQQELITYFKAKIEAGVSDGKTSLPPLLMDDIHRFPDGMRRELRVYAQSVLETDPNNGAAAKFLAIDMAPSTYDVPPDAAWDLFEKAMVLVPKDVELCYLVFENAGFDPTFHTDRAAIALERLFERHRPGEKSTLYYWLHRCYDYMYVFGTPNESYKRLNKEDSALLERWTAVMIKFQTAFEERLAEKPEDWNAVRMLVETHEALGNTDAVRTVFKTAQQVFEKRLEQDPENGNALNALANIHERLGNAELAYEYKVKNDPTLAWVGQVLPDFPATVDLEGKPISLAAYRSKVLLLDFWAVWCGPCIGEMPNVREVYKKYHDEGFDVIGISLDEDEAVLREFIAEHELPWRQILDSGGWKGVLAQKYGIRGIPAPFLLDREGKVISVKARGDRLHELVAAEIDRKTE